MLDTLLYLVVVLTWSQVRDRRKLTLASGVSGKSFEDPLTSPCSFAVKRIIPVMIILIVIMNSLYQYLLSDFYRLCLVYLLLL